MPETDPANAPESHTTPRWVKVVGMIALVVLALILALMLLRGGGHGPARHLSGAATAHGISTAAESPAAPRSARPI